MRDSFELKTLLAKIRAFTMHMARRNTYLDRSLTPKAVLRLLGKEPVVILEIGAADGLDTLKMVKELKHPESRIYCFEPDKRMILEFRRNINDPRVELIESAVGSTNGTILLNESTTLYSSSIKKPNEDIINEVWPEIMFPNTYPVNDTTLDKAVERLKIREIDFIWADVQGAESDLIEGARRSLGKCKYLYSEYSAKEFYQGALDLVGLTDELGPNWEIMKDYGSDVLLMNIHLKDKQN